MQLFPAIQSDDGGRAGYPSASSYERLLACRASHLLTQRAVALGQVAHQSSKEAELGARKHLANVEGPEILSEAEREDWETCRRKREEFIEAWSDGSPIESAKEGRLWLRKGIRPLLSGQPDEILFQGKRAAVLDYKFGACRVSDPGENVQLGIYSLLAARSDDAVEEVTCQILSPTHDFEPYTYSRAELEQLYQSVLVVINSLADPGDPVPGSHCQFCPAALICSARRQETQALSVVAQELPTGAEAARLLETVMRVESVCDEIKLHYKAQLEADPACVPGWRLVSSVRRWIPYPQQALERMIEQFSVSEFLETCSVSVSDLERAWAKKNNVPAAQLKAAFSRFMNGVVAEKRIAPSLRQAS